MMFYNLIQSSITMSKENKERTNRQQPCYLKYSVGSDISKDKFDSCISAIDSTQHVKILATRTFKNNRDGFEAYLNWVNLKCKMELSIVHIMEATGIYYEKFAWHLHRSSKKLSVVLPNKSKKYMQSIGLKTKTDKIDAKGLSRMGAEQSFLLWEAPEARMVELRSITRQRENLQKTRTQLKNQLGALKCGEFINEAIVNQQETVIALLDKQIKETEEMIGSLVNEDAELKERIERITSIKGLGLISVATVIAETFAFKYFVNQRQLVSYAGYDVIENQSGRHVGKTKISKKGNSHIRRILHLPSFCVVLNNEPIFKNQYDRVYASSKQKMKAYVAVQRKLLIMIYTLWKTNEKYERQYSKKEHPEMQSRSSSFRLASMKPKKGEEFSPPKQDELPYKAFAGSPLSAEVKL